MDKPPLQEQKLPPKPAQEEEIAEAPSGAPGIAIHCHATDCTRIHVPGWVLILANTGNQRAK